MIFTDSDKYQKIKKNVLKITYFQSATALVEDSGVKILLDPWFVDGAYYGSWAIYPPSKFKPEDFNDVDYIYISHIHPDHFNVKTLERMNKDIPILVLNYLEKFLKEDIEKLGFKVTELDHDKRIHLKNNLHINILAADNCNPELCGKFLGCGLMEKKFGATWIDSMCVIDNNKEVLINTNDCPFDIAQHSAKKIKNTYGDIDLLLVGYTGAGPYPQCFDLPEDKKKEEAEKKKKDLLTKTESYVSLLEPKFFMPFAGGYTLAGKNHILNDYRGNIELEDAFDYFSSSSNVDHLKSHCVILNSGNSFDITTKKVSEPYKRFDFKSKQEYIQQKLSKVKYTFESDPESTFEDLSELIPKACHRLETMRKHIGFNSDTVALVSLPGNQYLLIPFNGDAYKIISKNDIENYDKYVMFSVDSKLLKRLFQGPEHAHWNDAEIGSHIHYVRKPNIFERGLFYCMNYLFT